MSFSRLKPLPKALIIGAIVAIIGTAANYGLKLMPKKAPVPEAPVVEVTPVPAEQPVAPAPVAPVAPVAQTPKQAAEAAVQAAQQAVPQPAPAHDAGLSAVLGAGKK